MIMVKLQKKFSNLPMGLNMAQEQGNKILSAFIVIPCSIVDSDFKPDLHQAEKCPGKIKLLPRKNCRAVNSRNMFYFSRLDIFARELNEFVLLSDVAFPQTKQSDSWKQGPRHNFLLEGAMGKPGDALSDPEPSTVSRVLPWKKN